MRRDTTATMLNPKIALLSVCVGIALLLLATVMLIPRSGPTDFPSPKTWWAKRISSDLYTAGRLTERQIKYAAEAGFGSIISLLEFPTSYDIGADRVLNTTDSRYVAEALTGMKFDVLVKTKPEVARIETIRKFTEMMSRAPKPVLFHCVTAYTASFVALAYLGYTNTMTSLEIYNHGAQLGYDYSTKAVFRDLISNVTGEPPLRNPPKPDVTVPAWNKKYWLIKPVYRNWFMAGQIQTNYVKNVSAMGIDVIVNCRQPSISGRIPLLRTSQAGYNYINCLYT